jgi:hypothetical protein
VSYNMLVQYNAKWQLKKMTWDQRVW